MWTQTTTELALGFGLSLAIGILVGIERERHAQEQKRAMFAGIRTFPLICVGGALAALLSQHWGTLGMLAAFLALAMLIALSYWWGRKAEPDVEQDPGLTTEIAALLVFGIGAIPFTPILDLAFEDRLILAGALGAIVMALLSLKSPLHKVAEKVSREDLYATVRFLLLAAVILPLLPNEQYGRYGALNPFWIGVVVVLIAGVSFLGYLAVRFLGARRGIGFTALFGGLASSTAVTLSFSARGKETPQLALLCAFAVVLASTVMFPRMLVLLSATNPQLVQPALIPIGGMLAVGLIGSGLLYWRSGRRQPPGDGPKFENPFQLRQALKLGLLYAAVRLLSAAAHDYAGESGLYASAVLAGLADVDAITVSIARMQAAGESVAPGAAVVAITLAAVSNTVSKTGIALVLGGWKVGLPVALVLAPAAVVGGMLAWLAV